MIGRKFIISLLFILLGGGSFSATSLAASQATSDYQSICASCHGDTGKGNGAAAAALNPKPKDFTDCNAMAQFSDETLFKAVQGGGQSAGLSPAMPAWGGALEDQQIRDLVTYIRTLCKK